MLKYQGVLIVVEDMQRARRFYEECLEQKVTLDLDVNIAFEGGFSIHQKNHFLELLGGDARFMPVPKSHAGELYFETDNMETYEKRLMAVGAAFIHPVCEQPWGQRVMRFYDPDGHIIEIGETMEAVVRRFHQQGMTIQGISQKTGMPLPFVTGAIG